MRVNSSHTGTLRPGQAPGNTLAEIRAAKISNRESGQGPAGTAKPTETSTTTTRRSNGTILA